jgi:D-alanyl-D-alanine carboxypeptidase/D-alanyl-D-alanine-endopeptidase (penicillin-binding protein 4)
VLTLATTAAWVGASAPAAGAGTPPKWIQRIQEVVGDRPVSVAVGNDGDYWYRSQAWVRRPPASNEKLLLSMALFDRYGTTRTIPTFVMRDGPVRDGVLRGHLWLVGRGNPELDRPAISRLAAEVDAAGIRKVRGGVRGATGPFGRDWWATGWREYFPDRYIALPTALAFEQNEDATGRHITDPERRAALALTTKLQARGIGVRRAPGAGSPPGGMALVTSLDSGPLENIVRHMNLESRNFWAEVLGKRLGADVSGKGTIANGAKAICAYAARHGQDFTCHDASGLSYANRASALGILQLLWSAQHTPWGGVLRSTLPTGGQGTLEDRLQQVRLRAKTGTLEDVSALSGWVWLRRSAQWAEFSIMSSGFDDQAAKSIENQIVRVVSANASDPDPTD